MDAVTGGLDILTALINGARYDAVVATAWVAVPLLFSAANGFGEWSRAADRVRKASGAAFVGVASAVFVVTIGYFKEYNDQFNYFLFNLYYDDTTAIMRTIWAEHNLLLNLLIATGISVAGIKLSRAVVRSGFMARERLDSLRFPVIAKAAITLVIIALVVIGIRGSAGRRPVQLKDAAVTKDVFLNKAVPNPFFALYYAVQEHRQRTRETGIATFLPDADVRAAAQKLYGIPAKYDNLDDYLKKTAGGAKNPPARHIFLLVMESYDAWPLLEKYASLRLAENLKALTRDGLAVRNFLPASGGTMQSFAAIMTGLPYATIEINYQDSARSTFPSSLAEIFKRLGYRTRLFYGGFLSWQRIGEFSSAQGFDELYGAPHMKGGASTYEWGVDDEYLFDFMLRTVDDEAPSFNLVLTTSYHPPYRLDVFQKGYPVTEIPNEVAPMFDGSVNLKILGHLWYSDQCLGNFVGQAEKKLPRALFAITGDHYGRKFINAKPDVFERSAVPFILYGKEVLKGVALPPRTAGSHIDIGPTLVELAAPKGFTYYAAGSNLLSPHRRNWGVGLGKVMGPDFIAEIASPPTIYPLGEGGHPDRLPVAADISSVYNNLLGIGWWRVKRGPQIFN